MLVSFLFFLFRDSRSENTMGLARLFQAQSAESFFFFWKLKWKEIIKKKQLGLVRLVGWVNLIFQSKRRKKNENNKKNYNFPFVVFAVSFVWCCFSNTKYSNTLSPTQSKRCQRSSFFCSCTHNVFMRGALTKISVFHIWNETRLIKYTCREGDGVREREIRTHKNIKSNKCEKIKFNA